MDKDGKKLQIEQWRDIARYSNITVIVNGIPRNLQADPLSQLLISQSVTLASIGAAPPPSVWRSVENIDFHVTLQDMKTISWEIANRTREAYVKSFYLKYLVDQATTQAQLDAIVW